MKYAHLNALSDGGVSFVDAAYYHRGNYANEQSINRFAVVDTLILN